MKKTKYFIAMLIGIGCIFFNTSCNKIETQDINAENTSIETRGIPHWDCTKCTLTPSSVETNMDLAAAAYASVLTNHSDIESTLENAINSAPFFDFNTIEGTDAILEINSVLNQNLIDTLQNNLQDHSKPLLDTCVITRFEFATIIRLCCFNFKIRIPDIQNQNSSLPIIVFPVVSEIAAIARPQEDAPGFFIDTTTGQLTSMTHGTFEEDDHEGSFFRWYVLVDRDCETVFKEKGCDNDGVCEPLWGETLECEDCITKSKSSPTGTLFLKEITSLTDFRKHRRHNPSDQDKRYQECYVSPNYEIAFQYAIFNTDNQEVEFKLTIDEEDHANPPYPHDADILRKFGHWGGSSEIKRTKQKRNGNFKSNNGSHTTEDFNQSKILSTVFDPNIDELYFLLYEKDWKLAHPKNVGFDFGTYINKGNVRRPYTHNYSSPPGVQDFVATHGAANGGTSTGTLSNPGSEIAFIDNDPSLWIPIAPIGGKQAFEFNTSLDGEFSAKFVFIEN